MTPLQIAKQFRQLCKEMKMLLADEVVARCLPEDMRNLISLAERWADELDIVNTIIRARPVLNAAERALRNKNIVVMRQHQHKAVTTIARQVGLSPSGVRFVCNSPKRMVTNERPKPLEERTKGYA